MPRQRNLRFALERKKTKQHRSLYDEQNLRSAEIIMEESDKYGGAESLPVQWAVAILAKENQCQE